LIRHVASPYVPRMGRCLDQRRAVGLADMTPNDTKLSGEEEGAQRLTTSPLQRRVRRRR
jgi:hypothetical protein